MSAPQGHTFSNAFDSGPFQSDGRHVGDAASFARAERLSARGDLASANRIFRALARKYPNFYGAPLALGRNLARRGLWQQAEPALLRALKLRPSCEEAAMLLARLLTATARPKEAVTVYSALIQRCGDLGLAHLELGRLQRDLGFLTKAYREICAAADAPGNRLEALLERIPLEMSQGRFEAAFRDGEEILAQGLRREVFVDKLLFPFGEVARPPFTKPRLARIRGRLKTYLGEHADSAWGHCLNLALAMMLEAEFDGGPYLEALERLAMGRYIWMRWLMGAYHQRRMEWDAARRQFAQVVRAYPAFMRPKFLIGDGLIGLGRPREALAFFRMSEPTEPGHRGRWLAWMGEIHLRLGRYQEALSYLEKACAEPDTDALAFTWRGAVKQRLGRLDDALRDLDEGVRRTGNDIEPFNWRAENRRLRGQPGKALADVAKALRVFPFDMCALITRARIFHDMKRYDEMRQNYDAVAKGLTQRWPAALAKADVKPGTTPDEMRSFLDGSMRILENWLRAHDLMPEPLALALLEEDR